MENDNNLKHHAKLQERNHPQVRRYSDNQNTEPREDKTSQERFAKIKGSAVPIPSIIATNFINIWALKPQR